MTDINYRWWAIFLGSSIIGTVFVLWGDESIRATGLTLIGGALGVGATAKLGPRKE